MRILVVDDHPLIREALANVLRRLDADAEIEGARDCESGLSIAAAGPEPDLLLLDLNLPGLTGLAALRAWRSRFSALPVVVLSAQTDPATLQAVLAAGAAGFIPKSTSNELVLGALRLVLDGGRYLPPELLSAPPPPTPPSAAPSSAAGLDLTPRQLEVFGLLARGLPNKLIGRELGLAERTVKAHVTAVMRALGVSSRSQAAVAAARLGLGETPSDPV